MSEVGIHIVATDESGTVFESFLQRVNRLTSSVEGSAPALARHARLLDDGVHVAHRLSSAQARLEIGQITVANSLNNLASAQDRYNEAVDKFGPLSQQAILAKRELENATRNLERAQTRLHVQTAFVAAEFVGMAAKSRVLQGALADLAASATVTQLSFAAGVPAVLASVGALLLFTDEGKRAEDAARRAADANVDLAASTLEVATAEEFLSMVRQSVSTPAGFPQGEAERQAEEQHARAVERARRAKEGVQRENEAAAEAAEAIRANESRSRLRSFAEEERQRHARQSRNADFLAQELAAARQQEEFYKNAAASGSIAVTTDMVEEAIKRRLQLEADLTAAVQGNQQLRAAADAAEAASFQAKAQSVETGLASLGIQFDKLRTDVQQDLLVSQGLDPKVTQSFIAAAKAEELLKNSTGETRKALLEQLDVAARKGETTHQLAERLGLTTEEERELERQGRLTTEGIISQEEAARRAKAALDDLSRGVTKGDMVQAGSSLLTSRTTRTIDQERSGSRAGLEARGAIIDQGILLQQELNEAIVRKGAGALDNPSVRDYFEYTQQLAGGGIGYVNVEGDLRPRRNAALSFLEAARGFHGSLRDDTLILAHRDERVDISPPGGERGGDRVVHVDLGGIHIVNHIGAGVDARMVEQATMRGADEATRKLQDSLRRLGSLGTV